VLPDAREGFEVISCDDGQEALAKLEELKTSGARMPEIVLMDVEMPGINGYEACRRMRDKYLHTELAVIMLSGHGSDATLESGLKVGCNDCVPKPLQRTELIARIKMQLRRMRQIKAAKQDMIESASFSASPLPSPISAAKPRKQSIFADSDANPAKLFDDASLHVQIDESDNEEKSFETTSASSVLLSPTAVQKIGKLEAQVAEAKKECARREEVHENVRRESERMRAEHSKVLKEQAATMTQSIHQAVQHALETSVDARVETSVTAAVTAAVRDAVNDTTRTERAAREAALQAMRAEHEKALTTAQVDHQRALEAVQQDRTAAEVLLKEQMKETIARMSDKAAARDAQTIDDEVARQVAEQMSIQEASATADAANGHSGEYREHAVPRDEAKLRSVLSLLDLEHYTRLLLTQEVTVHVLSALGNSDLLEMGVSTMGARKRIVQYFASNEGKRALHSPRNGQYMD
jgi:CheY-like chemotaxis protein